MTTTRFKTLVLGTNLTGTDNGDDTITVDAAGGSPTGTAGGALDGTYPNPGLAASVAGAGLAETTNVLSVNVDSSTIEVSSDTLRVKDGGITPAKLSFVPGGEILITDTPAGTPLVFADLIQNETETDLVYGD